MLGLLLFARSIWSVVSNPLRLTRVYAAPLFVGVGFFLLPYLVTGDRWPILTNWGGGTFFYDPSSVSPWLIPLSWASFAGLFLCLIWAAVSWHRAVLLELNPRDEFWRPQFGPIARYICGMAVVMAILWVAWISIDLVISLLVNLFALSGGEYLFDTVESIEAVVQIGFFLSISPVMVASSIGQTKQFWQVLRATPSRIIVSLVCAGCLYSLAVGLRWFVDEYAPSYGSHFVTSRIGLLFLGMISISIMTTIYGHYVEGRELS